MREVRKQRTQLVQALKSAYGERFLRDEKRYLKAWTWEFSRETAVLDMAARQVFGIPPTAGQPSWIEDPPNLSKVPHASAWARHQYQRTQAVLRGFSPGRDAVMLWRGIGAHQAHSLSFRGAGSRAYSLELNSLSSWTRSLGVAQSFADSGTDYASGRLGGVLRAKIPLERVFALGALYNRWPSGEQTEFVILGGNDLYLCGCSLRLRFRKSRNGSYDRR